MEITKRIFQTGVWVAIAGLIELSLFSIANVMVAKFDAASISGFAILFQIQTITFGILMGICNGVGIYLSQSAGLKDRTRFLKGIKASFFIVIATFGLACGVLIIFPLQIFSQFISIDSDSASTILSIVEPALMGLVVVIVIEIIIQLPLSYLKSLNDTKYFPHTQAIGYIIVAPSSIYLLSFVYDFGLSGVMFGMAAGMLVAGGIFIARLKYTLNEKRIFAKVHTD